MISTKDDNMVEISISENQQSDDYDHVGEIIWDTLEIGMARGNDKGNSLQTEDNKEVEHCNSGMIKIFEVKL